MNNLNLYKERFERVLSDYLNAYPVKFSPVWDAVVYAVSAGGKRVRPALAYMGARIAGEEPEKVDKVALAVEFIHNYSLIHDDLPCMDDDDLRRGRPTVHKAFGEGTAVLAGDALLNLAFECIGGVGRAAAYIASQSGMRGMVGGQCLDLANSDNAGVEGESQLDKINSLKTSALFKAALAGGAIICGADEELVSSLELYADCLGKVFQIVDDILDAQSSAEVLGKSAGQDEKNGKVTYVSLLGIDGAMKAAYRINAECKRAIAKYGPRAEELTRFADYLADRVK